MDPRHLTLPLRTRLLARDLAFVFPSIYRSYQLGHLERLRRRIQPSYEPEIREFSRWRAISADVRLVVDVGANFGQSAWAFARNLPHARIRAFEASPIVAARCAALLRKTAISVDELAIGRESADILLHMPVYKGVPFPGLASVDERSARSWFSHNLVRCFQDAHLSVETVRCRQNRLDNLNLRPDVIKIDVEGAELDVIHGAAATIATSRPTLLVECNGTFRDVETAVDEYGYLSFELRGRRWVPSSGARLNQLFVHRARLESDARGRRQNRRQEESGQQEC